MVRLLLQVVLLGISSSCILSHITRSNYSNNLDVTYVTIVSVSYVISVIFTIVQTTFMPTVGTIYISLSYGILIILSHHSMSLLQTVQQIGYCYLLIMEIDFTFSFISFIRILQFLFTCSAYKYTLTANATSLTCAA